MTKSPRVNKVCAIIALVLAVLQVALILVSWIITAVTPTAHMRSILSDEGVRWFLGHFNENLTTPIAVWIVLLCMSYGAFRYSGLLSSLLRLRSLNYPQIVALRFVFMELVVFIIAMLMLTVAPHAILLGITGHLWPGMFVKSVIPCLCFAVCVFSMSFGMISGSLRSLRSVYSCLTIGIAYTIPLWLIYILGMELYCSFVFVFFVD